MKQWLYFLFTALMFSSCSSTADDILGKEDEENGDDGIC